MNMLRPYKASVGTEVFLLGCQRCFPVPRECLGSSAIQFAFAFSLIDTLIFQQMFTSDEFCCLVCGAIDFLELKYFEEVLLVLTLLIIGIAVCC